MSERRLPNRIREIRQARGLTMLDLAMRTNMSGAALSRLETGTRNLNIPAAQRVARVLGVSVADLIGESGAPLPATFHPDSDVQPAPEIPPPQPMRLPLTAQVPVWGVVEGGSNGEFEVNLTDGPLEYVSVPPPLVGVPDVGALFVVGESMAGLWTSGDTVFFAKRRPITPLCYVIVQIEAGKGEPPKAFLKQFVRKDNQRVYLHQVNPDMDVDYPLDQVKEMWRALHWREIMSF